MSAIDGVYFNHNGLTKTIEITNPTTGHRIRVGGYEYRTLVDQRVIDPNNLSPYVPREAIVNSYTHHANIINRDRSRISPDSYVTSDPVPLIPVVTLVAFHFLG